MHVHRAFSNASRLMLLTKGIPFDLAIRAAWELAPPFTLTKPWIRRPLAAAVSEGAISLAIRTDPGGISVTLFFGCWRKWAKIRRETSRTSTRRWRKNVSAAEE